MLMSLLRQYLQAELARLVESGARLTVIGRRDRLPDGMSDAIADAERASAQGVSTCSSILSITASRPSESARQCRCVMRSG